MDTIKINLEELKKPHWSENELQNVTLIADFIQNLMNNHDFEYVLSKFNNNAYVQHNRNIPDGLTALVDYVKQLSKRFPDYCYDVKQIFADGDYIIFHSHATVSKKDRGNDKKGFNIKDTWKVSNGQIVEHWDAIQPINSFMRFFVWLTGGSIRNANGLF